MSQSHSDPIAPASQAGDLRAWLEVALASARLATWSFEPSSGAFLLSDEARALVGVPDLGAFVPPAALLRHVLPADRKLARRAMRGAVVERGAFDVRLRVVLPDGGVRWLHVTARTTPGAEGADERLIGTARDVTRDFVAVEELRASQERHFRIAKEARDVPRDWDLRATRVLGSEEAPALVRRDLDVAEDISRWKARIHPEDRDRVVRGLVAHLEGAGWLWSDEYRFARDDGTYASVLDRGYVVRDGQGVAIRMMGSMVDLGGGRATGEPRLAASDTELRAIKEYEGLVERLARLAEAVGAARDLGTIFAGVRDFVIASVPCSGLFISLYDPERRLRIPVYAWADGEEVDVSTLPPLPINDSPHSRAVATGEVVITDDLQAATAGGPYVDVGQERDPRVAQSSLAVPLLTKQRVKGGLEVQYVEPAAYTDGHVTAVQMAASLAAAAIDNVQLLERERRREEDLRHAQRMEAIGRLAGGVAHDFNNLLTVITGYCDMITFQLDADSAVLQDLAEVREASHRAADLTRQLLAFSRRQVLQPQAVDLARTVGHLSRMLGRLIGEDIDLAIADSPGSWLVQADPGQVEQVIINLVVNARDAMDGCGRIEISTANVTVREGDASAEGGVAPGDYVRLRVADNGSGMDAETMSHIFDPFFTTKGPGKGTGLGLSTVYGIVKQSGGSIVVDSTPGHGATFEVYLPRTEAKPADAPAASAPASARTHGETVLLVEDEAALRRLAAKSLRRLGYRVLEAASGTEALRAGTDHEGRIDLLLTDVVMPEMSGRELAERLEARLPGIRVLYMSGYTDDAVVKRGLISQDLRLLKKPFTPDVLEAAVRAALEAG